MTPSAIRPQAAISIARTIAGCLVAAFLAMFLFLAFTAVMSLVVRAFAELSRTTFGKLSAIAIQTIAAAVGGAFAIRIVPRWLNQWSDPAYRFPRLPLSRGMFSGLSREVPFAVSKLASGILAAILFGIASFNVASGPDWHIPTFVKLVMSAGMGAFGFALGAIGWSSIIEDQRQVLTLARTSGEPKPVLRYRLWATVGLVAIYYPLYFGPFMQLAALGYFNSADQQLVGALFRPMAWILESGPPPFRQLLTFYLCFWGPTR
jgi:hypothetical protein